MALPAVLITAFALTQPRSRTRRRRSRSRNEQRRLCDERRGIRDGEHRGCRTADAAPDNGALGAKIASIALGQVGNGDNPSSPASAASTATRTRHRRQASPPTRTAADTTPRSTRNSNENRCSDFVKWVWQQAGITQNMTRPTVQLRAMGARRRPESGGRLRNPARRGRTERARVQHETVKRSAFG